MLPPAETAPHAIREAIRPATLTAIALALCAASPAAAQRAERARAGTSPKNMRPYRAAGSVQGSAMGFFCFPFSAVGARVRAGVLAVIHTSAPIAGVERWWLQRQRVIGERFP